MGLLSGFRLVLFVLCEPSSRLNLGTYQVGHFYFCAVVENFQKILTGATKLVNVTLSAILLQDNHFSTAWIFPSIHLDLVLKNFASKSKQQPSYNQIN